MRYKIFMILVAAVIVASCKKEKGNPLPDPPPPPPPPAFLLKDVVIPNLPSPYYHFEYDNSGKFTKITYASDLYMYNVFYKDGRISELRDSILVNHDRLQYFYDNVGRVSQVRYADSNGNIYERINMTYDGQKLVKMEWQRKPAGNFVEYKTLTMSYYPDGNLEQLSEHRPASNIQEETNFFDKFEQYDNKVNVDGFMLLHNNDFFEHFVILPEVQLQKNNPGKVTHTGSGINYTVSYTYAYDNKGVPVSSAGDGTWTNGTSVGTPFHTSAFYTYY